MREQKGITLIALVITIIVLLILAGVTIAMLVGQNGILSNANQSASSNAYYGADEQMKLAYMTVRTQIMAERVHNSNYNPAATTGGTGAVANTAGTYDNLGELTKLVKKDLGITPGTDGKAKQTSDDGAWTVSATGGVITISYHNTKIYGGTITKAGTNVNAVPSTNGHVAGTITVSGNGSNQTAAYAFDYADTGAKIDYETGSASTSTNQNP